jgi:UTP--glucose-1-phosphate uridylyltransferase
MLPATKSVPKELLPVGNVPAIQLIYDECLSSGVSDICVVLGDNKNSIIDYTEKSIFLEKKLAGANASEECLAAEKCLSQLNVTYVKQGSARGTAKALARCEKFVGGEPFCVVFPDEIIFSETPVLKQLITAHDKCGCPIVGVARVKAEDCPKYGMISYRRNKGRYYEIDSIVEKPAKNPPSLFASCGRFVLDADIFTKIAEIPPQNNEYYLPTAINALAKDTAVYAYEFEGKRFDTGNKTGFVQASIEYLSRDKAAMSGLKTYLEEIIKTI